MTRLIPGAMTVAAAMLWLGTFGPAQAQTSGETTPPATESPAPDSPPSADMINLPTGESAAETVFMRFVNSRTGLGITPGSILVDGQPMKFQVERQSLVALEVPAGSHTIEVIAEGFEPMRVEVSAGGASTPVIQVELDASNPPPEAEVAPDKAILLGTVSDADTAEPLRGAKVEVLNSKLSETTTATGEFRFELTTGKANAQHRPAVTLEVHADGYTPLRLKDLPLDAGGRARIPVKMARETSGPAELMELDGGSTPGGKYATDWTFDVSLR